VPPLPLPPLELRDLVGAPEPERYDNPSGRPIYPYLPEAAFESVLDFGCGCGRVARQLIQQRPRPAHYMGIDLHRGMIAWSSASSHRTRPAFASNITISTTPA
jgi:SAM-dependent methyltransferase